MAITCQISKRKFKDSEFTWGSKLGLSFSLILHFQKVQSKTEIIIAVLDVVII